MAQRYYSPISINSGQVPSTQTDFPVLVSQTDNRFKSTGNGGHVSSSSGFDIRPYSDIGLTTPITGYILERYNATTGEVVMWVKVASLSSSTTPIYLGYGDTSLTTDGSRGDLTFSNNFISVYDLRDGTTLSVADSTGTHSGTNHGATATTGKIDGGAGFVSASSQYISLYNGTGPLAITLSAWANATSFPASLNCVGGANSASGTNMGWGINAKSTGKLLCFVNATTQLLYDGTGATTLSSSTWYHLALTYDSTAGLIMYVNASVDKTIAANGTLRQTATNVEMGRDANGGVDYWNGAIDQFTISTVARSANWITTEYNNQSTPATFETLGTEVSLVSNTGAFFILFR